MRGRRGRPPKTLDASPAAGGGGPAGSLRYRAVGTGRGRGADKRGNHSSAEAGGRGSRTPRGGKTATRGKARSAVVRQGGRSRRLAVNKVIYDDHESEEDDESLMSEEDEDEEEDEREKVQDDEHDSDYHQASEEEEEEEEEDDASYCTESSFRSHSTYSSTPGNINRSFPSILNIWLDHQLNVRSGCIVCKSHLQMHSPQTPLVPCMQQLPLSDICKSVASFFWLENLIQPSCHGDLKLNGLDHSG